MESPNFKHVVGAIIIMLFVWLAVDAIVGNVHTERENCYVAGADAYGGDC